MKAKQNTQYTVVNDQHNEWPINSAELQLAKTSSNMHSFSKSQPNKYRKRAELKRR